MHVCGTCKEHGKCEDEKEAEAKGISIEGCGDWVHKDDKDWVAYLWDTLPNGERTLVEETGVVGANEGEARANADWVFYGDYELERNPHRTLTVEIDRNPC